MEDPITSTLATAMGNGSINKPYRLFKSKLKQTLGVDNDVANSDQPETNNLRADEPASSPSKPTSTGKRSKPTVALSAIPLLEPLPDLATINRLVPRRPIRPPIIIDADGFLHFRSDNEPQLNIYAAVPPAPFVDLTILETAQNHLKQLPLDVVPDIAPLPKGSRMPLSPHPLFRARDAELRTIAQGFKTGQLVIINQVYHSLSGTKPALTSGFGGMGKTQLANEFVHRYGQYFPGGVFWFNFSTPNLIPVEIISNGGSNSSLERADFRNLLLEEQLHLILATWQSPLPRLLIFDNCEDAELLAHWLPPKGGCRVLVTSRQTYWPDWLKAEIIQLGTLPRADSVALLHQYRPEPLNDNRDVDALAAELGDLPLALHLAGNFLMTYRNDYTIGQYLSRLQHFNKADHPLLISGLDSDTLSDHDYHILRVLTLSYEQLNTSEPTDTLAQVLLLRAAYFAPNIPIPRDLLLTTLHHGTVVDSKRDFWGKLRSFLTVGNHQVAHDADLLPRANDALARLVMVGLLELATDGTFYLHPMVSRLLRAFTVSADSETAVQETFSETSQILKNAGSLTALLAWQPHIQTVKPAGETAAPDISLPGPFSQQLVDHHPSSWERYYYECALEINERLLGENHPDCARSLHNLGILATYRADWVSGRFYFERALAIRLAELGEQHGDTAQSFNDFGALLAVQGDLTAAATYYQKALAIRQQLYGTNHPDTAQSFHNLGEVAYQQADYEIGQQYLAQALLIYQQVWGDWQRPEAARTWHNLAAIWEAQGEPEKALAGYEKALLIFKAVLGLDHPDTATALHNLGGLWDTLGKYREAQAYYETALAIRQLTLGQHHPTTATTLHNLAVLRVHQERYKEAKSLMEQALTIREATLPANHPLRRASQQDLAKIKTALSPLQRRKRLAKLRLAIDD